MAQSLSRVILHITFSTKNREPWLNRAFRPRMHAYLATICRDLGAEEVCVDGVSDHVHVITTLPRTLSQAGLIEEIKKASSKWIKGVDVCCRGFFLATRVCGLFGRPKPTRRCAGIRADARRTSSHSYFSGRIPGIVAQAWRGFRRTLCLGLRTSGLALNRAFSADAFAIHDSWGDAPGFGVS